MGDVDGDDISLRELSWYVKSAQLNEIKHVDAR
jgi:hypothetical protein